MKLAALALFLVSAVAVADAATPAAPAPIVYTIHFLKPATHYVQVTAEIPTGGQPQVELRMAVWTPGSYLVREYSRHVERVEAALPDGTATTVVKTAKNRWRIESRGAATVRVTYHVYAREMGVRTNYVDPDFALLNGAATFLTLLDPAPRPHEVHLELPSGWTTSKTSLPGITGLPNGYRAPDFDTLVDSPIVVGTPAVYPFTVGGVGHELVNVGEGGIWDGPRSARDIEQIVRTEVALWGVVPYPHYFFLNMITESGGGLEHKGSTVLMTSRWRSRTKKGYLDWLSTAAHEFFHAWNVKRLRPVELGPFDYEQENYTRSLWIAEGLTDYYGDLIVRRAGLSSDQDYLESLSEAIERLQTTPGRLVQSVEGASFDAWIKFYRPDENSPNVSVDYYTKGGIIGFLLDAQIREATGGAKSLDDVMRTAYAKFAGAAGYTPAQWKAVASEVAGRDLSAWFARAAESTEELDYQPALAWYGLRFRPVPPAGDRPQKAWLGINGRADGGRLVVGGIRRGSPADAAGLSVEDEILAIGDYRVRAEQWNERLEAFHAGDTVSLLVARRERLMRIDVTLGAEPQPSWRLEVDPAATPDQQAHFRALLK
jgi:predicted metalloprotease with PDZ domain